ncbi:uncharacterized protein LOC123552432 [Mercenaria mercenaria]|uniref:uncharacterized protein LOC123552432 n=1 Tax=Mercenaria mercenaria TaxID=6596 RepID=UPI00234F20E3|nr:uncharacterized protein LOC123552432 [Mercenaria mercenaria]
MEQWKLMNPPDGYDFNNLVEDFRDAMDGNDVRRVKRRFREILPEEVETSEQLVDSLVQNRYISDRNIVYLQQIVRVLNKRHLLIKTIEYADKQRQKVLHFRVSSTQTRPGYTLIKIHIEGHMCHTEEDVQNIRQNISNIVLVPLEDISVISIETTNSLLITFMLPELYAEVLHAFLDTKKFHLFQPLIRLGVDEIIVSGVSYNIKLGQTPIDSWYRKIMTIFNEIFTYPFNMQTRKRILQSGQRS